MSEINKVDNKGKVGVLTYHFANNYGAVLQAYALQRKLEQLHVDAEIINYCTLIQKSNNSLMEDWTSVKNIIKNILRLPNYKFRKTRIRKFQEFRDKYLPISKEIVKGKDALNGVVKDNYSKVIVGSDQVWNPNTHDFNHMYYDVVKAGIPTFSYAASLGNANLEQLMEYKESIDLFEAISMREESACKLIDQISIAHTSQNVMDPTMLIEASEYNLLAEDGMKIPGDYILCYYLGRDGSKQVKEYVKAVSKKMDMPVYFLTTNNGIVSYGKNVIKDAGPCDFLSLIKNAKILFTNSFHGTVFAIKFGTPFYTFESSTSNDRRRLDVLELVGLKTRSIVDFYNLETFNICRDDIIDASEKLSILNKGSEEYIVQCLR